MKNMIISYCLTITIAVIGKLDLHASTEGVQQEMNSVLVHTNDMAGLIVRKTENRQWITGDNLSKRTIDVSETRRVHSVYQEIDIKDIKVRIDYAEFDSNDEASLAARFRIRNVASVFDSGLWKGAKHKQIGDEIWHAQDSLAISIILRLGKICVYINGREGNLDDRRRVVETLAERIANRARDGARVPKLDGNK